MKQLYPRYMVCICRKRWPYVIKPFTFIIIFNNVKNNTRTVFLGDCKVNLSVQNQEGFVNYSFNKKIFNDGP